MLIAVGRGMPAPIRALVDDYRQRMKHFGGVELLEVAEFRRHSDRAGDRAKGLLQESRALRQRIPAGAHVVPLDSGGKRLSSVQFAQKIDQLRQEAISPVCFVIGGPDGLHADFIREAPWSLSLGGMTYPHLLARVLILEQLYRAQTILHGLPYHR